MVKHPTSSGSGTTLSKPPWSACTKVQRRPSSTATFPILRSTESAYPDWGDRAGAISVPLFGDSQWFELERKHMQRLGSYAAQMEVNSRGMIFADVSPQKEATEVTVERVCSGEARKRIITMTMTKPIRVAQDLGRTFTMKEPRYRYALEAEWEGTCNDGAKARFQYGPIFVSTPPGNPTITSWTTNRTSGSIRLGRRSRLAWCSRRVDQSDAASARL